MELHSSFSDGKFWIGRHSADGDTLVFDPARSTSDSANISLFSLTQFRPRTFPSAVVQKQIREIVDPQQRAVAEERYETWPTLKAARDRDLERAGAEAVARQREHILEEHKLFLASQSIPYEGVRDSSASQNGSSSRRHRTACHVCGIRLDDFLAAKCVVCSSILCSCGACGCGASRTVS